MSVNMTQFITTLYTVIRETSYASMTFNLPTHFSFSLKICAILSFSVIFNPLIPLKEKQKRTRKFSVLLVQEKK